MNFNFEQGEILLVDKPYKWTSFDVVNLARNYIRKQLGLKKLKIGHAGTLDPLASGLLILCTGRFTKRIEEFKEYDKEYTGTFTLGATTPSFDLEHEPDTHFPWEHVTEEEVRKVFSQYTGTFEQLPPAYSAIQIAGKRAYDYARKGEEFVMPTKNVNITAFELVDFRLPDIDFRVACSKGTYIRSLARDIGQSLGSGAHLTSLCRTRIGPYHLRDAYSTEELKKMILEL